MTIALFDKRAPLLALLKQYRSVNAADTMQRDTIVSFVEKHTDCFERTNLAGHITGSAWVTNKAGDAVLLTHHKKLDKWLQLGGHADGDTDIVAVARREAQEESGLSSLNLVTPEIFDVDIHSIPPRAHEPKHYHYDIRFAFRANEGEPIRISDESNKLEWVPLADLTTLTNEESMLRMAAKWKRIANQIL